MIVVSLAACVVRMHECIRRGGCSRLVKGVRSRCKWGGCSRVKTKSEGKEKKEEMSGRGSERGWGSVWSSQPGLLSHLQPLSPFDTRTHVLSFFVTHTHTMTTSWHGKNTPRHFCTHSITASLITCKLISRCPQVTVLMLTTENPTLRPTSFAKSRRQANDNSRKQKKIESSVIKSSKSSPVSLLYDDQHLFSGLVAANFLAKVINQAAFPSARMKTEF